MLTGSRVLLDKRHPLKNQACDGGVADDWPNLGQELAAPGRRLPRRQARGPGFSERRLHVENITLAILFTENSGTKNKTEMNPPVLANRAHVDTRDTAHLYVLISSSDFPPVWRTHTKCQDPLCPSQDCLWLLPRPRPLLCQALKGGRQEVESLISSAIIQIGRATGTFK